MPAPPRRVRRIRSSRPATRYQYRVAPFDVLSVIVWDHPELTIPAGEFRAADAAGNAVQADGTMFYPHVGVVEVAGKTLPEIRALLTERLRKFVEQPAARRARGGVPRQAGAGHGRGRRGRRRSPSPTCRCGCRTPSPPRGASRPERLDPRRDAHPRRRGSTASTSRRSTTRATSRRTGSCRTATSSTSPPARSNKVFVLGEVRQPSSKLMAKGRMSLAEAIGDAAGLRPAHVERRRLRVPRAATRRRASTGSTRRAPTRSSSRCSSSSSRTTSSTCRPTASPPGTAIVTPAPADRAGALADRSTSRTAERRLQR